MKAGTINFLTKQIRTSAPTLQKSLKTLGLGITLAALTSCGCDTFTKSKEKESTIFIINNDTEYVQESEAKENVKPKTDQEWLEFYQKDIDNFMTADKNIAEIKTDIGYDNDYINAYKEIRVNGYNNKNELVKQMLIYPEEPSSSCAEATYSPKAGSIEKTAFGADKTITEYEYKDYSDENYTKIEYKNNFEFEGKKGYKKTETLYPQAKNEEIAKTVIFVKGKVIDTVEGMDVYSKDSHKCTINYNNEGIEIDRFEERPDEYGFLTWVE